MKNIPYTKPSITKLEIDFAADAVENGWGENCYNYIDKFETDFAKHIGTKYAIATSSCTGALTMGLAAIGIGPGDEVIMADTNWVATVAPIVHLGAIPIFIDISNETWCIDCELIENKITEKTKAIIATHLYGNLCDMDKILEIAKRYDLEVIEDSAEAIGSIYKGKKAGSIGKFGTFSFHGTKTITTGEGGVLTTNDKQIHETVLALNNHGRSLHQKKQFWADQIGFKFKISNVQAAIGCAQLERVKELVDRKREILEIYRNLTIGLPGIRLNPEPIGTRNGAWMPTVVFEEETGITREIMQQSFEKANIDARVFFWPLSSLPMFEDVPDNLNAYSIPERAMNLPSFHDMLDGEIERVVDCLKECSQKFSNNLS